MPDLRILETKTGKTIFASKNGGNHWYLFTPDNRVLMAFGHNERGSISLFDPKNLKQTELGSESAQETVDWNSRRQAFVVLSHDYQGLNAWIWGYNLITNQMFLSDYGVIEAYTWTPDGDNVLYSKSEILNVSQPDLTTSYGVVRLILAPIKGESSLLLGHYNYDFHLCYESEFPDRCEWKGDWFPIRRIRASSRNVGASDRNDCLSYGIGCPNPAVHYLINWHTGSLALPDYKIKLPSTATPTPSPTPTATHTPTPTPIPGPDLSRKPLYVHPSGTYAFYVGLDGTSLWLVPGNWDVVLWVANGENFIFVP